MSEVIYCGSSYRLKYTYKIIVNLYSSEYKNQSCSDIELELYKLIKQ